LEWLSGAKPAASPKGQSTPIRGHWSIVTRTLHRCGSQKTHLSVRQHPNATLPPTSRWGMMPRMTSNLVARTIEGRTAIVVIGPDTPEDGEWQRLVEAVRRGEHERTLVVTAGGGPSPRQRQAILEAS